MNILFEDDHIIVCEKPYGLLSQQDCGDKDSAVKQLSIHTGGTVYPVHRLDRTTRGVMVFAKTKFSAGALSRQITDRLFSKEYKAVVHGAVEPLEGELCDLLFYDRRKGKSYVVNRERAGVKRAVLHYSVLSSYIHNGETVSEVYIKLETGRTHQIRVQFASRGYPLLGDRRYGAGDRQKEISLCAFRLSFTHPVTKEQMQFSIPLC